MHSDETVSAHHSRTAGCSGLGDERAQRVIRRQVARLQPRIRERVRVVIPQPPLDVRTLVP